MSEDPGRRAADGTTEPVAERFGRIAIRNGFVTEDDLRRCEAVRQQIASSGRTPPELCDVLIEQGYLTTEAARKILHAQGRTRIPGYVLSDLIGRGTTGPVFRATMLSMNRTVAVRILDPELTKDAGFVERFRREARAAAWLNHEHVVSSLDVGESGGHYFCAMDYAPGPSIADLLARDGPWEEKPALELALMVTRALEHAHRHGILHGDVKPARIVRLPDGTARVLGFGGARRHWQSGQTTFFGTPGYIAPERVRGAPEVDGRADIYSLGACLYEMLTGRPPFEGEVPQVLRHHVNSVPVDPRRHAPGLTKSASALVMEMLATDPADRPADPRDLSIAIEQALLSPREVTDEIVPDEPSTEIPLLAPIAATPPAAPRKAPVLSKAAAPMKLVENAPVSTRGGRSGRVGVTEKRRRRGRRRA